MCERPPRATCSCTYDNQQDLSVPAVPVLGSALEPFPWWFPLNVLCHVTHPILLLGLYRMNELGPLRASQRRPGCQR